MDAALTGRLSANEKPQIGVEGTGQRRSLNCLLCSQITLRRPFRFIDLSTMEPSRVENTPGNGLVRRPRLGASSRSQQADTRRKLTGDDRNLSRECVHPSLRVYVTNDTSDVYEDRFTRLARDETGQIQPTLVLLGLRLGIEHITSVYWDGLRAALQVPQSVGIAG